MTIFGTIRTTKSNQIRLAVSQRLFGARFGVFTGVNQRAVENYAQRFC
ncbi:hypothetical protein HmCmsJML191_03768 [Escherichia coli]|nr:hypothetical protein HmCmsJML191_03768 [Escherichia coli]